MQCLYLSRLSCHPKNVSSEPKWNWNNNHHHKLNLPVELIMRCWLVSLTMKCWWNGQDILRVPAERHARFYECCPNEAYTGNCILTQLFPNFMAENATAIALHCKSSNCVWILIQLQNVATVNILKTKMPTNIKLEKNAINSSVKIHNECRWAMSSIEIILSNSYTLGTTLPLLTIQLNGSWHWEMLIQTRSAYRYTFDYQS